MAKRNPESQETRGAAGEEPEAPWGRLRASLEELRAAGQRQNDPAALARRLSQRAQAYRTRAAGRESGEASVLFLAFTKGRQRYGALLEHVLEVQALEQLNSVPHAPSFVRGVIPWRGAILALLDLGRLFQVAEAGLADVHHCVIVEAAGRRVAVAAHHLEEIYTVPASRLQAAPELRGRLPPEWVFGVYDDDCLILRLDLILQDPALTQWRNSTTSESKTIER